MAYLLRAITGSKWDFLINDFEKIKTLPADPIGDLSTKSNKTNKCTLSFFIVDDYNNIPDTIIAGFAANRQNIHNVEIVIIDDNEFSTKGFTFVKNLGKTPCDDANNAHRELINLKARDLIKLAMIIYKYIKKQGRVKEYTDNDVEKLIKKHINEGNIKQKQLQLTMKKELGLISKCVSCGN